ncbi:MAG: M23 family metallopeptidase [Bacteroidota bacterium]
MSSVLPNRKILTIIICIVLSSLLQISVLGQYTKVEQVIMFSSRLKAPVEMDVKQSGDKIVFNALNKSYYPYNFRIEFSRFHNLSPRIHYREMVLQPGRNRLFTVKIINEEYTHNYEYSISYIMADFNKQVDMDYPYLLPLKEGYKADFFTEPEGKSITVYPNIFIMNPGDTVCAVRKGVVTALPNSRHDIDRIIEVNSVEIRHSDGSVAVYEGLNQNSVLLKYGQTVYPGQPIGLTGITGKTKLNIYKIIGNARAMSISNFYCIEADNLLPANQVNGLKCKHPLKIVEKEMTNKEKRKRKKGKLSGTQVLPGNPDTMTGLSATGMNTTGSAITFWKTQINNYKDYSENQYHMLHYSD